MDPSEYATKSPVSGDTMPDDVPPGSVSGDALRTLSYEIEREVALGQLRDNEIVWSSVEGGVR